MNFKTAKILFKKRNLLGSQVKAVWRGWGGGEGLDSRQPNSSSLSPIISGALRFLETHCENTARLLSGIPGVLRFEQVEGTKTHILDPPHPLGTWYPRGSPDSGAGIFLGEALRHVHRAVCFMIAKHWTQPGCPVMGHQLNILQCSHTLEHDDAIENI